MTPTPEQIAAGLTSAQKRYLKPSSCLGWHFAPEYQQGAAAALARKGVLRSEFHKFRQRNSYCITETGIAVRAVLLDKDTP